MNILSLPEDVLEFIFSFMLMIPPTMARHPLQKKQILALNIERLEAVTKELNKNDSSYSTQLFMRSYPTLTAFDIACSIIFSLESICKTWRTIILQSPIILSSAWIYIQYFEKGIPLDTVEKVLQRKTNLILREEVAEFSASRRYAYSIRILFSNLRKLVETTTTTAEEAQHLEQKCLRITKIPEFRKYLTTSSIYYHAEWHDLFDAATPSNWPFLLRILKEMMLRAGITHGFSEDKPLTKAVLNGDFETFKRVFDVLKELHSSITAPPTTTTTTKKNSGTTVGLDEIIARMNGGSLLTDVISCGELQIWKYMESAVGIAAMKQIIVKDPYTIAHAISIVARMPSNAVIERCMHTLDYIAEQYGKPVFQTQRYSLSDPFLKAVRSQAATDAALLIQFCMDLESRYNIPVASMRILSDFMSQPSSLVLFLVKQWSSHPKQLQEMVISQEGFAISMVNESCQAFDVLNALVDAGVDMKLILGQFALDCQNPLVSNLDHCKEFVRWANSRKLDLY